MRQTIKRIVDQLYACLQHKLSISVIIKRTYSLLEQKVLLPCKQKGYQKGSYKYKDQILVKGMIIGTFQEKKRSFSKAWIDNRKVFNSVSHSWTLKALNI